MNRSCGKSCASLHACRVLTVWLLLALAFVIGTAKTHAFTPQTGTGAKANDGVLDVVVLDENAKRMVGATVSVPGFRSTTGLAGSCRFGLAPGRYSVLVNKDGYRGRRVTAGVRPGETASLEVKLQKLQPVRPPKK